MQFVNLELVRRLEASEAAAAKECAQFLARKNPASGAVSVDIMGGMAAFHRRWLAGYAGRRGRPAWCGQCRRDGRA